MVGISLGGSALAVAVAIGSYLALTLLGLSLAPGPPGAVEWAIIQVFRSVAGRAMLEGRLQGREEALWAQWEGASRDLAWAAPGLLDIPLVTPDTKPGDIDLSRPFLAKNMSAATVLSIQDLLTPPLRDLEIDYFIDARKRNTVPDGRGLVGDIVSRMQKGGADKLGTQMILKAFPGIMEQFLDSNPWLADIFGVQRVAAWRAMGTTVTSPVFASRGRGVNPTASQSLDGTTRTDLHCEPISNLIGHTAGAKTWTLVEPKYSYLLRPTIAPDGRAYFYSSLDPFDPNALSHVPRYEVLAEKGDILYVPTWTWHRIQYLPDITAVSISIFEFVPSSFLRNNGMFAISLIPNLIKEVVGIKAQ
jgi:hypothetical protein